MHITQFSHTLFQFNPPVFAFDTASSCMPWLYLHKEQVVQPGYSRCASYVDSRVSGMFQRVCCPRLEDYGQVARHITLFAKIIGHLEQVFLFCWKNTYFSDKLCPLEIRYSVFCDQ